MDWELYWSLGGRAGPWSSLGNFPGASQIGTNENVEVPVAIKICNYWPRMLAQQYALERISIGISHHKRSISNAVEKENEA